MTVGIIATCHTYFHFLDQWAASIRKLETQPDQVVLAVTDVEETVHRFDNPLPNLTMVQADPPFGLGKYLNRAIQACETDWIVWAGIDDHYRPHALNGLDSTDGDVVAFGIQYSSGQRWIPTHIDAAQILTVTTNLIPSGSPFRRVLWEKEPFNVDLEPFEDWALWVGFAAAGAQFCWTDQIDYDYTLHPQQIVPPMEPTRTRIKHWAETLGHTHGDN